MSHKITYQQEEAIKTAIKPISTHWRLLAFSGDGHVIDISHNGSPMGEYAMDALMKDLSGKPSPVAISLPDEIKINQKKD